jgi:KaiC/GvpD/RAD55 family RecA-like ATPase
LISSQHLLDGVMEIYERELKERARRFLIVKKMYGRKYVDTELMLDRDRLYSSES